MNLDLIFLIYTFLFNRFLAACEVNKLVFVQFQTYEQCTKSNVDRAVNTIKNCRIGRVDKYINESIKVSYFRSFFEYLVGLFKLLPKQKIGLKWVISSKH